MAQRTIVHLIDDLDGGEGEETLNFGLDGSQYQIDLSKEHADELRDCLAPYIEAARRYTGPSRLQQSGGRRKKDLADVRAWANENGFTVSARGRIPTNVVEAYDAAH